MFSIADLDDRVKLRHVLDAHEVLDLKAVMAEKADRG